jgi:hypothetical protein
MYIAAGAASAHALEHRQAVWVWLKWHLLHLYSPSSDACAPVYALMTGGVEHWAPKWRGPNTSCWYVT